MRLISAHDVKRICVLLLALVINNQADLNTIEPLSIKESGMTARAIKCDLMHVDRTRANNLSI